MDKLVLKNRLKEARSEKGWSQAKLAETIGVSRNTISSIETLEYCPSAKLAKILCIVLERDFDYLFYFDWDSMKYFRIVITLIYGLLYLYAGIKQYKESESKRNPLLIIIGSIFILDGVIYDFYPNRFDWLIEMIGCAMICIGTYLNGKDNKNIHISHHIIRLIISLIIVVIYTKY